MQAHVLWTLNGSREKGSRLPTHPMRASLLVPIAASLRCCAAASPAPQANDLVFEHPSRTCSAQMRIRISSQARLGTRAALPDSEYRACSKIQFVNQRHLQSNGWELGTANAVDQLAETTYPCPADADPAAPGRPTRELSSCTPWNGRGVRLYVCDDQRDSACIPIAAGSEGCLGDSKEAEAEVSEQEGERACIIRTMERVVFPPVPVERVQSRYHVHPGAEMDVDMDIEGEAAARVRASAASLHLSLAALRFCSPSAFPASVSLATLTLFLDIYLTHRLIVFIHHPSLQFTSYQIHIYSVFPNDTVPHAQPTRRARRPAAFPRGIAGFACYEYWTTERMAANELVGRAGEWDVVPEGVAYGVKGSGTEEDGEVDVVSGGVAADNPTCKDCVRGKTRRRESKRKVMPESLCPPKMRMRRKADVPRLHALAPHSRHRCRLESLQVLA
ncbi:hypothetical protein K438DRAFT_1970219 [Mycena galopus ATCC 62051]|nr:hypothetical protein K438DRAFT_1970219 [Mycena galopus ATCC 62051]